MKNYLTLYYFKYIVKTKSHTTVPAEEGHTSLFVSNESENNDEVTKLIYENGGTLL